MNDIGEGLGVGSKHAVATTWLQRKLYRVGPHDLLAIVVFIL